MSVLIFGATGAIGSALAKSLHAAGRPAFLAARNTEKLESLANGLGFGHSNCDVMVEGDVARAVEEAASANGPIAGLVYAIGDINLKPLSRATTEDFLSSYRLNVLGAAEAVQAAQASMAKFHKEEKIPASIVFFSSVAATNGFTNHAIIGSSKAALEGLTVSLAAEMKPKVRVNCIAPSLSESGIAEPLLANEAAKQAIAKAHPMRRLGRGEDHAAMAKFLLTDEQSGWVTGQIFAVDGGRSTILQ